MRCTFIVVKSRYPVQFSLFLLLLGCIMLDGQYQYTNTPLYYCWFIMRYSGVILIYCDRFSCIEYRLSASIAAFVIYSCKLFAVINISIMKKCYDSYAIYVFTSTIKNMLFEIVFDSLRSSANNFLCDAIMSKWHKNCAEKVNNNKTIKTLKWYK